MLCYHGRLSLGWFLISLGIVLFPSALWTLTDTSQDFWWILFAYVVLANILVRVFYSGFSYQVAVTSVLLGNGLAVGLHLVTHAPPNWDVLGCYMCIMCFFHYSEFLAIAWCNPRSLSVDSFVLNHSPQYGIAAVASWLEFALTQHFFPGVKSQPAVTGLGLVLCVAGEALRKTAMVTAGPNFDHIVQTEKVKEHRLVTSGVYGWFRHPSYVGWFYWSLGTQLVLVNPLCSVAYLWASWRFFKQRIENEERTLLYFFGKDYERYQRAVGTGLPGIRGFTMGD